MLSVVGAMFVVPVTSSPPRPPGPGPSGEGAVLPSLLLPLPHLPPAPRGPPLHCGPRPPALLPQGLPQVGDPHGSVTVTTCCLQTGV